MSIWNLVTAGPWDIPPPAMTATQDSKGTCITNVDGACIAGGYLVAGTSGYNLPGLNNPNVKCAAFPLFAAQGVPYTSSSQGYQTSTDANALNVLVHQ